MDTNVLSETCKPRGDEGVKRFISSTPAADLYLSAIVVGEVRRGIERPKRRNPDRAEAYRVWLSTILTDYADRIIPVDAGISDEWGHMSVPDPVLIVDGLMAAIAKVRRMTFVTRNAADVARTGTRLLNPFEADR